VFSIALLDVENVEDDPLRAAHAPKRNANAPIGRVGSCLEI
jgi:hypothetical protein